MKKKPNKLDDQQLGKILDLLCSPYTSDDFWLGVQMILSTNVSQERFCFFAARNGKSGGDLIHMVKVVYRGKSADPSNNFGTLEGGLRDDFLKHPWKRRATPRLPWGCVENYSYKGERNQEDWQIEWEKRRPSLFFVLSQRFDETLSEWIEEGDAKHKVRIFFILLSILLKLKRAAVASKDWTNMAKLAEKESSLQHIRMLTRIAAGYNRNEGSPGFLALSQYSNGNIARLKFFKWELEQERKK